MESMSWSDETRCLHCDGKLPLYRKLTSGQFCSASHRKAYWKEQERLAVERLHQTHDSLHAFRPPGALEEILGPPAESNPYYTGAFDSEIGEIAPFDRAESERASQTVPNSWPIDEALLAPAVPRAAYPPTMAEEIARRASNAGEVPEPGFLPLGFPVACSWQDFTAKARPAQPEWPVVATRLPCVEFPVVPFGMVPGEVVPGEISTAELGGPVAMTLPTAVPSGPLKQAERELLPFKTAPQTRVELSAEPARPEFDIAAASLEATVPVAEPVVTAAPAGSESPLVSAEAVLQETDLEIVEMLALPRITAHDHLTLFQSNPEPRQLNVPVLLARLDVKTLQGDGTNPGAAGEAAYPECGQMLALPRIAVQEFPSAIRTAAEPITQTLTPSLAPFEASGLDTKCVLFGLGSPVVAGLALLSAGDARNIPPCPVGVEVQPLTAPPSAGSPLISVSADAIPLRWKFADGIRYPIAIRDFECGLVKTSVGPVSNESVTVELPCEVGTPIVEPSGAWLLPVPFEGGKPCVPAPQELQQRNPARIDVNGAEPSIPVLRLSPIEGTLEPQSRFGFLTAAARNAAVVLEPKYAWTHAVDFWQHAPRDLKLLAFAIPLLLGLALHPSLPKFSVTPSARAETAKEQSKAPSGFEQALRERFTSVRQTVAARAGVELTEDFRAGLDGWQSRGDLSAAWSFDSNGFVRPGMLALYHPSMNLKDYDMSFLGLIDKKALSFVVRAQDFDNYYVVKIEIVKPGPLPTLGITRYAVIDGKPQARTSVVAPINARLDTLYRVGLSIHDDTYLLEMQGVIVDSWTEARLTHGGVGFFTAHGEQSRLRWVQVTHQYDMLGRLCAYLAPYNIPITNGSW